MAISSVRAVDAQTKNVDLAVSRKSADRAKGKRSHLILRGFPDLKVCRYIKELADRVSAIEGRPAQVPTAPYPPMGSEPSHMGAGPFAMGAGQPAMSGQPAHGLPSTYPGIPIHSSPQKRTHSMSEEPDTSTLQARLHASAHLRPAAATNMSMQQPNPTPVLHPGEEGDKVAITE